MTVKELIHKLQQIENQNAKVWIRDLESNNPSMNFWLDKFEIKYNKNENVVEITGEWGNV